MADDGQDGIGWDGAACGDGIMFVAERQRRCAATLERDLAATTTDAGRRRLHLSRAHRLQQLVTNPAEALLIAK